MFREGITIIIIRVCIILIIGTSLQNLQKFFSALDSRLRALQCLTAQMPDSALCSWGTAVTEVEDQVDELQSQAQETGTALQVTLQVGTTCDMVL